MKEREYIGHGVEHTVFKAHSTLPMVLKKPNPLTLFGVKLHGGPEIIKRELQEAYKNIENTGVLIPKTRVIPFARGYVIAQEYIPDDSSVSIEDYLLKHGNERLIRRYASNAANFIASGGTVYQIDTTVGVFERILLSGNFIKRDHVEIAKDKVGSLIRAYKKRITNKKKISN